MIDLHTHSSESDGTHSPVELIRLAAAEGIKLIALTDHDTVSGIKAAQAEAQKSGIRFVPGIEIAVQHPSHEFHILGLGIKADEENFIRGLEKIKQKREERNSQILKKINAAGINLTYGEVESVAGSSTICRPHFARILMNRGIVDSFTAAFKLYLGTGKPFYAALETLSLEEAIALIKKAGGIAVAAHPVSLGLSIRKLKEFLLKGRKAGLEGIEVYHPYHSRGLSKQLEKFCLYNHFIITGGSDFHGKRREERRLGFGTDNTPVPENCADYFWVES